jgi:hypothetical protein
VPNLSITILNFFIAVCERGWQTEPASPAQRSIDLGERAARMMATEPPGGFARAQAERRGAGRAEGSCSVSLSCLTLLSQGDSILSRAVGRLVCGTGQGSASSDFGKATSPIPGQSRIYCRPKQFHCRPRLAAQLLPIRPAALSRPRFHWDRSLYSVGREGGWDAPPPPPARPPPPPRAPPPRPTAKPI